MVLWRISAASVALFPEGGKSKKKKRGSVAEWSKALDLGSSLSGAWVRIPPLPAVVLTKAGEALRVLEKSLKILWEHFSWQCLQTICLVLSHSRSPVAKAGWLSPAPGEPSFLCGLLTTCIVADDLSQSCVDLFFQTHRRLVVTATQPQALTRLGLGLFTQAGLDCSFISKISIGLSTGRSDPWNKYPQGSVAERSKALD